jgi:phospholipase/carboxylesterase
MIIHNEHVEQAGATLEQASKALVMIHGRGDSARDFIGLHNSLNISRDEYAILAPQAIQNTWYPHGFMVPVQQNEPQLSLSLSGIGELVDNLQGLNLQPKDIYFLGFSQGACLMLEFCARHARRYGGMIAFTEGLIGQKLDISRYPGKFGGTPVFIGSSTLDPHVPESRIDETETILTRMEANVFRKIYPGMGHTINQDELRMANLILNDKLNPHK